MFIHTYAFTCDYVNVSTRDEHETEPGLRISHTKMDEKWYWVSNRTNIIGTGKGTNFQVLAYVPNP